MSTDLGAASTSFATTGNTNTRGRTARRENAGKAGAATTAS